MILLHIDSSILGEYSISRQISAAIVARLGAANPSAKVIYRDLAAKPVAHLSGQTLTAQPGAQEDVAAGAEVLEEFISADIIVIGVPMYNFTVPTQLKSWIDRILIVNRTFKYTETGPVGLAGGKRVVLALSRGGFYGPGTLAAGFDHQEPYLRAVFGFIGINEVEVVRAEGIAISTEQRQSSLDGALKGAGELAA